MSEATRNPIGVRYDLLVPEFLEAMAQLMHAGTHYDAVPGEPNWQKGLPGEKSPINHIMDHLVNYQLGYEHDHLVDRRGHLAAIALNAMFEFWFELKHDQEMFDAISAKTDADFGEPISVTPIPEPTTQPETPQLNPYQTLLKMIGGVKSKVMGGAAGDSRSD